MNLLLILRLLLLACLFMTSCVWARVGTVESILGTAKIHKRTGQMSPAIRGDFLYEGDTVISETSSNVQIRMIDGALIWLRANSEFKVNAYKSTRHGGTKDESNLQLLTGSMRTVTGLIGKRNDADYRLSTPNATIGVRGTEFDAVYVSSRNTSQFQVESGTYHRVYQGATQIGSPGQPDLRVEEGQAVFISTSTPDAPRRLQQIPDFLNLPANATRSTGSATGNTPPATTSAPARQQWLISVRYGNTTASAGANTNEHSVRLDNGKPTMVAAHQILGLIPMQLGQERLDSSNVMLSLTATSPDNRQSSVQVQFGDLLSSARKNTYSQYKLSLDISTGVWTEVSTRGPWQAIDNGRASTSGRLETQKVYIKAEEARQ